MGTRQEGRRRLGAAMALMFAGIGAGMGAGTAAAEEVWLQIEANRTRAEAEAAARDWAGTLPDISGFAMDTGMFATAIGPFGSEAEAEAQRRLLRREGMIPGDSYLTDGRRYGARFWPGAPQGEEAQDAAAERPQDADPARLPAPADLPQGDRPRAGAAARTALEAAPAADPAPERAEAPGAAPAPAETPAETPADIPAEAPEETPEEARAAERALGDAERRAIQEALAWEGVYEASVDGAFGSGTRRAMAAWQAAQGREPTGILTTSERARLLGRVAAAQARIGLAHVVDDTAGIEIDLPMGLLAFDRYDAPFAHYAPKDGSGVTVLLISQQGDPARLAALYDLMQTLDIVPLGGRREQGRQGFVLSGRSARLVSHTEVGLKAGLIKGFTLVYPPAREEEMARVLAAMRASFRPVGSTAMDDTLGAALSVPQADLLSGLDVRRPVFARSGFYLDASGAVLTAAEGLDACRRITVDAREARREDAVAAAPFAVLRPEGALAPRGTARLGAAALAPRAQIAAAGYSYGEALSAPVVTFGTVSAPEGLDGQPGHARLALDARAGDAGGPVLDAGGAVVGMILPRPQGGRDLPPDLAEALQMAAILPALAPLGIAPAAQTPLRALAAEDLAAQARAMTVRVACWD